MTTKELENYEPKGQLIGFPKEIIARMLECQEEQVNKRDITVFENLIRAAADLNGFNWNKTKEGCWFWNTVIDKKDFNLFFEKYPKKVNQYNSHEFKVGDKVIYFITNKIGTVKEVKKHKFDNDIDIIVDYGNNDVCEYEIVSEIKRPFLLHYRDDYNYDIIDFNNLPKKQEHQRWRAEKKGWYHLVNFNIEDGFYSLEDKDTHTGIHNIIYNSGNYFRTEVEAEIIAQELNSYFKQLIKGEHDTHRN
jgi:hypothetical protein